MTEATHLSQAKLLYITFRLQAPTTPDLTLIVTSRQMSDEGVLNIYLHK